MTTPLRVLVVDDDEDHRLLLRRLLARAGIADVCEAADGASALALVEANRPDLVLLDLAMPVRSGFDVLPEVAAASPGSRIVVLSGFRRDRLLDAVRMRGAVGYVQKDVAPDRLVAEVLLSAALTESAATTVAHTTLTGDPQAARDARRFVRDVVGDAAADLLASVELLVSELVTNAVVHALGEPEIGVQLSERAIRVEVADDTPALPHRRTPDALRPGGRGLLLLDRVASRWGVDPRPGGKVVWFELDRGAGGAAPPR